MMSKTKWLMNKHINTESWTELVPGSQKYGVYKWTETRTQVVKTIIHNEDTTFYVQ